MEDYKFFSIIFMNDKFVTAVSCFGSPICNQATRIKVNIGGDQTNNLQFNIQLLYLCTNHDYTKWAEIKIFITVLPPLQQVGQTWKGEGGGSYNRI